MHVDIYRCCVHVRDFLPGASIPDQILAAIRDSRSALTHTTPTGAQLQSLLFILLCYVVMFAMGMGSHFLHGIFDKVPNHEIPKLL